MFRVGLTLLLLCGSAQAQGLPAAPSCAAGVAAGERQYQLPPKLLGTIAVVESGRGPQTADPQADLSRYTPEFAARLRAMRAGVARLKLQFPELVHLAAQSKHTESVSPRIGAATLSP